MTPSPNTCDAYADLVGSVLDGAAPLSALDCAHITNCVECTGLANAARELQTYSEQEIARRFAPPARFATLVSETAVSQFRRTRRIRYGSRFALAASLLVAVGFVYRSFNTAPSSGGLAHLTVPTIPTPATQPSVTDRLTDASDAISAITKQTTERAIAPTRTLLATANQFTLPAPRPVEPMALPELELQVAARVGIEPVASTTRRAYDLFMRDFGIAPVRK